MFPFTLEEYQVRLAKTKERMSEKGIDVLLLTDPANMNYLSGYNGWCFYVHQMLVVLIDEDQPIWIGRGMDANVAKQTTWLMHERIIPYPDDYVQSDDRHPMDFIAKVLADIGQGNRRIGVESDTYYYTAKAHERLTQRLADARFVDATNLVNYVRIIKSDMEIHYMKCAGKIAAKAMYAGMNAINAGARESDVVAAIYHAQIAGTEEFGGDYPAIVPLLPSGVKTSAPHITWSDQRYPSEDTVIIELAGCYQRYHAPLARTVTIGKPQQRVVDVAKIAVEGLNEVLAWMKPGVTCEEVEAVWRKTIGRYGLEKEARIGYSAGLNYPPDWGEHTASIRKGDKTVLQANMTFHLIPGMWYDDFGVEISESVRVTENGCELLCDFPRQLLTNDPNASAS
ncbi:M24 family metallopeptidase [Shouchella clausii]|uniref:M24 family metallopeptidase n=1 Tax=Shouchella clausii TaxID=79880 RepID=UPI0027009083|nr:M24 family metallopeptidase [Shouchella clausii]MDO7270201.1 M24 family metallopeptidase [Shouchella clausii]MDO7289964.1 M24 family metallopeptidase [Shouchella clausii]